MRLLRTVVIATTLVATPAVVLSIATGPASAHEHPTNVELIAPAVVQVETYAEVSISLIEHNRKGAHIGLLQQRYTPSLAVGSGFAVDPTGGIVTSREVTNVNLRRAEIFAVNQIFHQRYGAVAPLPADPYTTHQIKGGAPADQIAERLQRCYQPNTTDHTGGCVVFSRRMVRVLPFVSNQKQYGNLQATVLTPEEGQPGDVVVLKVGASSMPAARLATSVQGAPFTVLGFTSVPSNEQSLRKLEAHFTAAGSTELKRDKWLTALAAAMGTGVAGGPVVGERGDVMGFLIRRPGGSPSDLTLVQPAAIRAALSAAKIDPHSGPTDSAYESAMHNYKNKLYTAAIPSLAQTVKLYPGHALATEALAQANRKKGTADDLTGRVPVAATTSEGDSLVRRAAVPLAVAAIALIVLAGVVVLLLRRRRRPGRRARRRARRRAGRRGSDSPGPRAAAVARASTIARCPTFGRAATAVRPPWRRHDESTDRAALAAGLCSRACRRHGGHLPGVQQSGRAGADVLRPVRAAAEVGGRRQMGRQDMRGTPHPNMRRRR